MIEQMRKLTKKWIKSKSEEDRKAVVKLLEDPKYKAMSYRDRNAPFLTAHKLKTFRENPFFAYLQYEVDTPEKQHEAFIDGQAIDDLLTDNKKDFEGKYEVVARRSKGAEKIQLTSGKWNMIDGMRNEYNSRHFFPDKVQKHNIVFLMFGKIPCKMELDHLEFGSHFGDLKSTANIVTFDPHRWGYDFTMSFYYHGIKELYDEKLPGHLYVLDKSTDTCRSDLVVFTKETLEQLQGEINQLAMDYVKCQVSGVWPFTLDVNRNDEDRKAFFESEFYSHPLCKQFKDTMEPLYI